LLIAVISDIHANLEALETCLKKIDEIKPDKLVCLGDLVDYCAEPNECVELVKSRADVVVVGNHDRAQIDYSLVEDFTENAYISSVHTRSVIKPQHVEYFKTLPYTYSTEDLLFVHASPRKPEEFDYIVTSAEAKENFKYFREQICFIGHSHYPCIFEQAGGLSSWIETGNLNKEKRYIINVGSVGQPRDGDYRACFGLFDMKKFTFKHVRLDYPVQLTSNKIINEGLPVHLAERILVGV
jgi:predicted phosphodiesterase